MRHEVVALLRSNRLFPLLGTTVLHGIEFLLTLHFSMLGFLDSLGRLPGVWQITGGHSVWGATLEENLWAGPACFSSWTLIHGLGFHACIWVAHFLLIQSYEN